MDKRYNPVFQRPRSESAQTAASALPSGDSTGELAAVPRAHSAPSSGQPIPSPHLSAFDEGIRAALAVDNGTRGAVSGGSSSAGSSSAGSSRAVSTSVAEGNGTRSHQRSGAIPPIGERQRAAGAHDLAGHVTDQLEAVGQTVESGVSAESPGADPFAAERPHQPNVWVGVLWFIAIASIAISVAGYWYQTTVTQWGFQSDNGSQQVDFVVSQLVYAFCPPLVTVGLATIAGLLFRLALRRDRRNDATVNRAARARTPFTTPEGTA